MKYCFIDLETTGTDPGQHGIIQIAGDVWIGGERVFDFDYLVRPLPGKIIDPKALEINKQTPEEIAGFPLAKDVHAALVHNLGLRVSRYDCKNKMFFIGYFAHFDYSFLRRWFEDLHDSYFGCWFWNPPIDVAQHAMKYLLYERHNMPDFKLATVARKLGLKVDDASLHNAKTDVELTREMFWKIRELEARDGEGTADTGPRR